MLIIFATHPIQYQVPLWKKLTEAGIKLEVWYFTDFGIQDSLDAEFGKAFSWDIPMLEGYKYRFLKVNRDATPNNGFMGIIIKDNIKQLLKKQKATHVYINGWQVFGYWQILWAAKSLGLVTIFKGESNDLKPEAPWKWPLKKIFLSRFFNKVDFFLSIGLANRRLYFKHGIPEKKIFPGLYCVDNRRFKNDVELPEITKDQLKENWNIDKNRFCILFSGKFIDKKRPLDIIKAVERISCFSKKLHLIFVGDGPLYNLIKESTTILYDKNQKIVNTIMMNDKPFSSIIGFLNQSEIAKAYTIADCLILPSDYNETWGLVVNEALACGIPAIVSNQCGSAEDLVMPIDENLVFKTGDVADLSRAIAYLMVNPIAKNQIENVIDGYTYQSTIDSINKILKKQSFSNGN